MRNNIIFNKTLLEYNKRYKNRTYKLLKFTRQEVDNFNKKYPLVEKDYLLKDRKWWLINGTYYEQPKKTNKVIAASLLSLCLVGGTTLGVGQGVYHWFGDGGGNTPQPVPPGPVPPVEEDITITLEANTINKDGYFKDENDKTVEKTVTVKKNSTWSQIKNKVATPVTDNDGWNFSKWYTTTTKETEIKDEYKFTGNSTIHADYSNKFYEATWTDIANKISTESLAKIKEDYGISSFIGQEKPVKLTTSNGETEYKVRVVGEKTDKVDGVDKLNALTFEFVNALTNVDGFQFNASEGNVWDGSTLQSTLNNETSGFYSILPSELQGTIVKVNKKTNSGATTDKLFVPSLSEMGIKKNPETTVDVEDEGEVYDYYKNETHTKAKTDIKGNKKEYWLRSNDTNATKKNVWGVNKDGLIGEAKSGTEDRRISYASTESFGIAPCFCIGKEEPTVKVKFDEGEHGSLKTKEITVKKFSTWSDIKKDSQITIPKPTPESGYNFVHWSVDKDKTSVEIEDSYKFSEEEVTLYPYYEKLESIECLTFTSNLDGSTIKVVNTGTHATTMPDLHYKKNDDNFSDWDTGTGTITLNKGDKLQVYGVNEEFNTNGNTSSFRATGSIDISGDVMCLIYNNENPKTKKTAIPNYAFYNLFAGEANTFYQKKDVKTENKGFKDITGFRISANEIGEYSCRALFACCTELHSAPTILTPTIIKKWGYADMFNNCWELKTAPTLSVVDASPEYCYYRLFANCTALSTVPTLTSEKVGDWSYGAMFLYCENIVDAPLLASETLDVNSYCDMFKGCIKLINAPKVLPALEAKANTYSRMFEGCAVLENAPEFKATTVATATSDKTGSFVETFKDCAKLKHVKVHFTNWKGGESGSNYTTYDWFKNIAKPSSKSTEYVFECPTTLGEDTSVTRDEHHVTENWTVVNF